MRHRKKNNHLGRKTAHRQATLANMASSLILHKRISTTIAKAKALRVYVEPLITKSKLDSTHSRRVVFSYLKNKNAVSELFRDVAQKIADRPGGYTRILKTGFRKGDGAEMCFIELVDYNENMLKSAEDSQQKRTRRGRSKKKEDDVTSKQTPVEKTEKAQDTDQSEVKAEAKPEEKSENTEAKVEKQEQAEDIKQDTQEAKAEKKEEEKSEPAAEKNEEKVEDKKTEDEGEKKEDDKKEEDKKE